MLIRLLNAKSCTVGCIISLYLYLYLMYNFNYSTYNINRGVIAVRTMLLSK